MFDLESKLRPPEARHPWARDVVCLGLLVAMAAILPISPGDGEHSVADLVGQMATVYLLPAMGFLLALRCGAIDLGVWVNMGLGGIVAASLINAGLTAGWSLLLGAIAGLGVGVVNAAIVARLRLPSPVVTLATAVVIALATRAVVASPAINVSDDAFANMHMRQQAGDGSSGNGVSNGESRRSVPLSATRMLIIVIIYALAMMAMLGGGRIVAGDDEGAEVQRMDPKKRLVAALCASGLLSTAGGALWLMQAQQAPTPGLSHLVGDLRIPAAAVLAGGLALAGPGRTLLACVCLPPAMLLATSWRQDWPIFWSSACPVEFQYLALIAMAIVAHESWRRALETHKRGFILAACWSGEAILLMAFAGRFANHDYHIRDGLRIASAAIWLAGTGCLMATYFIVRAKEAQAVMTRADRQKS